MVMRVIRQSWLCLPFCAHEVQRISLETCPDFEANSWEALSPTGSIPSVRSEHTAVWSDTADGFFIFGGYSGSSRCLSGATLENLCQVVSTVKTAAAEAP